MSQLEIYQIRDLAETVETFERAWLDSLERSGDAALVNVAQRLGAERQRVAERLLRALEEEPEHAPVRPGAPDSPMETARAIVVWNRALSSLYRAVASEGVRGACRTRLLIMAEALEREAAVLATFLQRRL